MSESGSAGELTILIDPFTIMSAGEIKGMFPCHAIKLHPGTINPLSLPSTNIAIASLCLFNAHRIQKG